MTIDIASNNRRIAKNTLLLYFRTLIVMLISLYTSRIILSALGETDYGIYNVVGGVVAMFSVISGSLSSSISRFITYEMGQNNSEKLKTVFASAMFIQVILSLIIVVLAETVGLWFLNTQMNIPDNRMEAANWVFHISIFTFVVNLLYLPYHASIIAHERMSAFAYISIFDALCKLLVSFLILLSPFDRLVFYAILMGVISVLVWLSYNIYCYFNFSECRFKLILDKSLLKQMFGFAGWAFIGSSSVILRDQGGNILINIFCGPSVNAARSIAYQVNSAIHSFVSNFTTALNPQIIKLYSSGNREQMMTLIIQGARLSFFMLLILSLPVIFNAEFILSIWLKDVPEHTCLFLQLVLINALAESISTPLVTAMLASGKIRNYQLVVGGLNMLNLPISFICLRLGAIPETIMIVSVIISQFCLAARIYMLKPIINFDSILFLKNVCLKSILVVLVASILPILFKIIIDVNNWILFLSYLTVCFVCTLLSVLYIGVTKNERIIIFNKIKEFINKILTRK